MKRKGWGRTALCLCAALIVAGCVENGTPCVEVTHVKKAYPKTWPSSGLPVVVYDSSYKRCGEGVK